MAQVRPAPYLSALGAWALAFGCSVGWGSFVMPGSSFLPIAGPVGTAVGIALGAAAMLVLGLNYHFLMNRYPDAGGTYTYTKKSFGFDHGFLSAWFLLLTYMAIIWANATALPLIARTLLGPTFQFGFEYEVAGFHVFFGEILLAIASLLIAAFFCLRRKLSMYVQIGAAVLLVGGVVACFVAAMERQGAPVAPFEPAFAPGANPSSEVFTIFALAPWAFVGFESISHSASDAKFPMRRAFAILAAAIVVGGLVYALLALLAATSLPEGCASWTDYVANLGEYSGVQSQPTFFAAYTALGDAGSAILGIAALCGILTGLIGHYVALSRLMCALADDDVLPEWFGKLDKEGVPTNAIVTIVAISVVLPFFGRTAISWIVDVTTVGAIIAYAFASASAFKSAREGGAGLYVASGVAGILVSLLFAVEFLVPNLLSVKVLSTESYFILAVWGILGFVCFRAILLRDRKGRFGRSTIAWVVLLGLIVFTSNVWMRQATRNVLEESQQPMVAYIEQSRPLAEAEAGVGKMLDDVDDAVFKGIVIQVVMNVCALAFLFDIYRIMQKRERQVEVEKVLAEESSRAKTSFLSNMSHEIRTPMNAIIGLDSIALRNPDISPRTREHLEKIGASAQHLLGLINDILDMSRIESGRMALKNEEFSLREFLDQVNIIINGQCVDKGLHYECSIAGRLNDYYYGDDMKLKQVLINILGNSVKFTDAPGDVTLAVEQIEQSEGTCTLRFTMSDTGIGMDEEFIPQLFEAFSQEDATSTNRYGGSGLGMAITKNFVEMMDGSIDVWSKKGVGSVFTVTVKLQASERSAHDEYGIVLPSDIRAIVVDDDPVACEHAELVLRSIDIEATACTDPVEAVETMREARRRGEGYTLLLTDYRMEGMNGLELVRTVHGFDGGETSVIMLTGYNWDIIEEDARADGVDAILSKPLFPDSLSKEIHSVLMKRFGKESAALAEVTETSPTVLEGCRVLMAEDVEQNAEILEDLLDLEGIEADHARNGQLAVDMFQAHPAGYYDAILMDVRMPVMDGLTATRTIRGLERRDAQTIPIIAMTANVFDEDVERSMQAGMDAHLSKPVVPEHLYDTMSRLITAART